MARPIKFGFDMAGLKGIKERLEDLKRADALKQTAGLVLFREATKIMNASKLLVPVVTGFLRQSGHVQLPAISGDRVVVTFGYAAEYAFYVHENPRAGQTGGLAPVASFANPFAASVRQRKYKRYSTVGTWKFLEIPYLAWKAGGLQKVADALRVARAFTIGIRKLRP